MIRLGALATQLKKKANGKKRRKRTPSEEEVESLKKKSHTAIEDIDIRENSKNRLRFRKMPWTEVGLALFFWGGALIIFLCFNQYRDRMKG